MRKMGIVSAILIAIVGSFSCDENIDDGTELDGAPKYLADDMECVIYVDDYAPIGGDGNSWDEAYPSLEEGIEAAESVVSTDNRECEVWVSGQKERMLGKMDSKEIRSLAKKGVHLFSGFVGDEEERSRSNAINGGSIEETYLGRGMTDRARTPLAYDKMLFKKGSIFDRKIRQSGIVTTENNRVPYNTSSPWWQEYESTNRIYYDDGFVGLTTPSTSAFSPTSRLHIKDNTMNVNTVVIDGADNNGVHAALKIMDPYGQAMIFDGNEIDSTNSKMLLNYNVSQDIEMVRGGGNVGIGSFYNPKSKLQILGYENSGTADGSGGFRIVNPTSKDEDGDDIPPQTLVMDGNEIDVFNSRMYINRNANKGVLFFPWATDNQSNSPKVGIGTNNPTHLLTVDGTIKAEEIVVDTVGADFVFEAGYQLRTLEQVETFVKDNNHLPDVPSAKEMQENGASLSSLTTTLLQKVEELTLYTIDQNKRLKKLEEENQSLRESIGYASN